MPSKKFKIVHRIPNSNILIDYWKQQAAQDKYHRFMTYLRIDANESIKDICESTYTVYTSLFNKWYLITYYQVSEHRLIELRVNETINVYDVHSDTSFSVTAFDANYYTGSLMFLFQGTFGKVLYTGFFRPSSFDPILQVPLLKSIIDKRELDVAYIDNTYAAKHCEFPTRSDVLSQIISCLRQHSKHKVAISGKRLGKEEILLDIAKALDEKICVSEDKFVILSRLNVQNYFTTDKRKSRIYAYDYIINPRECMRRQARYGPYIVILLTAFYHCETSHTEDLAIPGLYIFPYSGHCSHSELVRFVSQLKPRDVQPILKFEDVDSPNSIIPPCITKLCYKPLPLPDSPTLPRSRQSTVHYNSNEENVVVFKMATAVAENITVSENQIVTNRTSDIPDRNDLRCLDSIEEFLESVSSGSTETSYESTINDSMITINTTTNASCQTPGVSGLNNSSMNNALITSRNTESSNRSPRNNVLNNSSMSNAAMNSRNIENKTSRCGNPVSDYNRVNRNKIIVQSMQTSSSVIDTSIHDVDIIQILNENNVDPMPEIRLDFPITTSPPNVDTYETYHTACSQQNNENVISTSCTTLDNATMENINVHHALPKLPKNSVYPRSCYTENEIAENIISSTNNESFTDVVLSTVDLSIEEPKSVEISSKTSVRSNFDTCNKEKLSLQTAEIDSPKASEREQMNTRSEKDQTPKYSIEVPKTYENKATETEVTVERIRYLEELEKSFVPHNEEHKCMENDLLQRIVNYMSSSKGSKFDTNKYYDHLRHKSHGHCGENCTIPNCKECETAKVLESNKRKRKIINSTLYNYSLSLKSRESCSSEKWNNLNGCDILSHPIFKNMKFGD